MTIRHLAALVAATSLLHAEDSPSEDPATSTPAFSGTSEWDVSLPEPITDGAVAEPSESPAPVSTQVISSNTIQRQVSEPPPMSGLPPVTGRINVTLQVVEAPDLPEPPSLLPSSPTDPAVQAQLQEMLQAHTEAKLALVSASVYDNQRTLLRICHNGGIGDEVTAWSNLDFNLFTGWSSYRINNSDGSTQDCHLLMGIGDIQTATLQQLAADAGQQYEPPAIPALPDLSVGGPAFQVISGEADSPAMDTLEQLHDLFRKEGERMTQAYAAREQAEAERRAELLANPPQPADVTIRYWKGNASGTEVAE